jgi:GDP-L-fucose synthase
MNIGLGHDYSINDYYKKVGEIMRFNGNYYHNLNMPIGMQQKLVSIEKQNNLGWKPNYNLEDGLKKIIKYYFESIK